MAIEQTEMSKIELSKLRLFEANKPNDDDYFGFGGAPLIPGNEGSRHLLILNKGWHEQRLRYVEDREVVPEELKAQIECVISLIKLIERGPKVTTTFASELMRAGRLTEFAQTHPQFYVTATDAEVTSSEARTAHRYIAKLEGIQQVGEFPFENDEAPLDIIVSDEEGNIGPMPEETANWKLAHATVRRAIILPRYITDGWGISRP